MTLNQQQKNKRAGSWAERSVAQYLRRWWPQAEQRHLEGIWDRGDISGIQGVVVEVKNERRIDLAGYLKELEVEMKNDDAEYGVVVIRKRGTTNVGEWYALMPMTQFTELLTGIETLTGRRP